MALPYYKNARVRTRSIEAVPRSGRRFSLTVDHENLHLDAVEPLLRAPNPLIIQGI